MTSLSNTCEGTPGSAVTTSNSAGPDQFTTVTATGAGTTCTYTSAHAFQGSTALDFHLAAVSSVCYTIWTLPTSSQGFYRALVYLTAYPTVQTYLARFYSGTTGRGGIAITAAGTLRIADGSNGTVVTTPAAIPLNQFVRVEFDLTGLAGTTGDAAARFFSGANVNSNTPDANGSITATGLTTGGATLDTLRIGSATTVTQTAAWDLIVDQPAAGDTTQPGPATTAGGVVSVTEAQGTGAAVAPSVDALIAVTGGGPATATGRAFAPSTAAGGSGVSPTVATGTGRAFAPTVASAPLLIATPDPTNSPPRILLTVGAATGTTVTITRINADRTRAVVRETDGGKQLVGAATAAYDYEAPYNQPVTYVAVTDDPAAGPTTSDPVTLTVDSPWLIHPGIPDLSRPLTVRNIGDESYATDDGTHYVLGREKPIVISDGVRHSPTFDLVVKTSGKADTAGLQEILADASPLLLQVGYAFSDDPVYAWVTVGQVTKSPVNRFVHPDTIWTLPCTEVDPPVGALQAQRTLADVAAQFLRLKDAAYEYASLRDLYIDAPIGT